jgi:hypothetical protein
LSNWTTYPKQRKLEKRHSKAPEAEDGTRQTMNDKRR